MKFTDGNWLLQPGVLVETPTQLYDYSIEKDRVFCLAPTRWINHRGATLDGAVLTYKLFSPLPNVIGVRIYHHTGKRELGPHFELETDPNHGPEIMDEDRQIVFVSGETRAVIPKDQPWELSFYFGDRFLTKSANRAAGYITWEGKGAYMREQLDLGVGECVYGMGERFTAFVKNGQVVDIWNRDGGTGSEQAYKNVPFYITNRGYGVFVNHPEMVSFEVASERVSKVQFSVEGEYLEYFIIGGADPKQVLERYTALTGRPAVPPKWSFGLWLSTSFTTDYDEATVTSFIEGMAERDIPLHVFHFDCFWMKEFHWCNFQWDKRVFPDPEGMLRRLKERGLKICVWINPYIAQQSELFEEAVEKGYLIKRPDGSVWQWDKWQAGMGIVDFTNPEACRWYQDKLRTLLAMGVDCFKTDFGERIPLDVVYYDGSDPAKMHNYYSYLFNKVVFDLLKEVKGDGEAVVFARSGTAGSQKFPVHWGGDNAANYESMAESLRGGLSLCLSGFGFWSHDIGGFEHTATPEVYKRWTAFGLLSSHSRLHGNISYRVPWLFDEEAIDVMRHFTKLKCRLMPYLYAAALEAGEKGIPMMRAMFVEFPDDPGCDYLDRQYMFGENLLVAPVFSDEGDVDYYLPEGIWTHFLTGERVEGGRWVKEKHDFFSLPLLARPNSIIPVGAVDALVDYDYAQDVTLHLFELEDGAIASVEVGGDLRVTAKRDGTQIMIHYKGAGKPWQLYLRGVFSIAGAEGARAESAELGLILTPESYGDGKFVINL